LFYYEDRPLVEVATLLDITQSAAKVCLHRARRHLAQLLEEERTSAR
jgi:RNA polymerase sigma-70 factor (ECF subfamily)